MDQEPGHKFISPDVAFKSHVNRIEITNLCDCGVPIHLHPDEALHFQASLVGAMRVRHRFVVQQKIEITRRQLRELEQELTKLDERGIEL